MHTLRFELQNDSVFFNILKTYLTTFKDSFAVTADFQAIAEQVSGRNLTTFFNQWIYGEGYPTYSVQYYKWGDSLRLFINQRTSVPQSVNLFKGLMQYKIKYATGDTTVLLNQTVNNQEFRIAFPRAVSSIVVDPDNWVINKIGGVTAINLLQLTGTVENDIAHLRWATAPQINFTGYKVERSADGIVFNALDSIMQSQPQRVHLYDDMQMPLKAYYRIKASDETGSFIYSNVVLLNKIAAPSNNNIPSLSVVYNTVISSLQITGSTSTEEKMNIIIYAADGKRAWQKTINLAAGANNLNYSQKSLAAGIYIVSINTTAGNRTFKIKR